MNVKMSPRSVCVFDDMYISATIRGSKCVTLKLAGQAVIPEVQLLGTSLGVWRNKGRETEIKKEREKNKKKEKESE